MRAMDQGVTAEDDEQQGMPPDFQRTGCIFRPADETNLQSICF